MPVGSDECQPETVPGAVSATEMVPAVSGRQSLRLPAGVRFVRHKDGRVKYTGLSNGHTYTFYSDGSVTDSTQPA